jgi:hypothetical protein
MTMASKYVLVIKDGAIEQLPIKKPPAPRRTFDAWHGRCVEVVRRSGAACYAFRLGGVWSIYHRNGNAMNLRTFDTEDGCAMFMLARGLT